MEYLRLKDVCDINMGQSPTSDSYNDDGDGVPFFQGNADFGDRYPVTRKWCNAPTKMAQPGDILISVRAPIGAINYAKEECCIGRGLAAVTPDRDKVSPDFVFWFLKGKKEELNSKGTGSTFKAISRKVLEEILVPNVDLKEQSKCAEILEKIYFVQKSQKQELKYLDDLIKARFVEMFDSIKEEKLLGEISEFVTVGIANSATHAYAESGIPMLRNQNIRENYLDDSDLIYIKPEFAAKYESKELKENDIIVMRTGYPGVACLVPKKYEGCQTFTTLIVRLRSDNNPSYVCNYINSDFGKRFVDLEKVGVAQQNVGARSLAHMPIKIAPRELQDKFATFVKQIDKSKSAKAMKEFNCHIIYYMLHFIQNDFNKNNLNEM